MAIPLETLLEEVKCYCGASASTSERVVMALLQRIAEAGGGGGGTPSLPLNSVQFNNAGAFGGSAELTFNDTTNVLQLIGSQNILQVVSNVTALTIAGHALTAANAQSMISGAGTWNTSGNPVALRLALTDTASGATSKFLEFLGGAGGATSAFSVDRIGNVDITTIGSLTASAPALEITQTWNNAAVAFTGIDINVTDTASASASLLQDWRTGGVSQASIRKNGFFLANFAVIGPSGANQLSLVAQHAGMAVSSSGFISFGSGAAITPFDTGIGRNSAGVVEITDGTAGVFADLWARHLRLATAFTVATLPAAGVQGRMAYVTDALTPTFLTLAVGGGAVITPVFDNGSSWVTV